MPRNGYKKCIEIMANILSHGYKKQVPAPELEKTIKRLAGMDERTVSKYQESLTQLGFLSSINSTVFKIERHSDLYHDYPSVIQEEGDSAVEAFNEIMDESVAEMIDDE